MQTSQTLNKNSPPQNSQELNQFRLAEIQKLISQPLHTFNDTIFTTLVKEIYVSTDNEKGKPNALRFVLWCGVEMGVELFS